MQDSSFFVTRNISNKKDLVDGKKTKNIDGTCTIGQYIL